ncbi:hypothetical protein HFO33_01135 [Rhizobium leguminosarum]|uniref:hypothetical protein n=1 Tax=Rhizobium leguminosarum TaxID=384 RepID=UPI001C975243|nr:hypothetical protein [Rhizobium leguminosarum]MBY5715221.1 hypothetical protein [Rhizobium leguminosarum]
MGRHRRIFRGHVIVVGAGLVGKYLRLVETAINGAQSIVTTTPVLGPVVAFVALAAMPLAMGAKFAAIADSQVGYNNYYGAAVGTDGLVGTKANITFLVQSSAKSPIPKQRGATNPPPRHHGRSSGPDHRHAE